MVHPPAEGKVLPTASTLRRHGEILFVLVLSLVLVRVLVLDRRVGVGNGAVAVLLSSLFFFAFVAVGIELGGFGVVDAVLLLVFVAVVGFGIVVNSVGASRSDGKMRFHVPVLFFLYDEME